MELDVEDFKNRYQLTPKQLRQTKMTAEDIEIAQNVLLTIEDLFLENIADWSLEESFFLYDEKEDLIYRFFNFSKGMTKCFLVINSEPQIELISNDLDNHLLLHISNILVDFVIAYIRSWNSTPKLKTVDTITFNFQFPANNNIENWSFIYIGFQFFFHIKRPSQGSLERVYWCKHNILLLWPILDLQRHQ